MLVFVALVVAEHILKSYVSFLHIGKVDFRAYEVVSACGGLLSCIVVARSLAVLKSIFHSPAPAVVTVVKEPRVVVKASLSNVPSLGVVGLAGLSGLEGDYRLFRFHIRSFHFGTSSEKRGCM